MKYIAWMIAGYIVICLVDMYIIKTREPHFRCGYEGKD